ncbi:hypothetical protein OROGR_002525 [Orobanche gracilis]
METAFERRPRRTWLRIVVVSALVERGESAGSAVMVEVVELKRLSPKLDLEPVKYLFFPFLLVLFSVL